jgi:50S ribosomal subunit-associated GTPase HflX
LDLFYEVKNNFTKEGEIQMVIIFNKMDLASSDEIKYLRDKLDINENEFFLINALSGENLELLKELLTKRYSTKE